MKLESRGGLLLVGLTIEFRGHTMMVDDLVVDTGAVQSLISIDAVDGLDIAPEPEDECVFMRGIGGRELSLRKRVNAIRCDTYHAADVLLDFGQLAAHEGINGLIGLDILESGRFVIDLNAMQLRSMASSAK